MGKVTERDPAQNTAWRLLLQFVNLGPPLQCIRIADCFA
jgi:hypothetical protein